MTRTNIKAAFQAALPHTIPIVAGFLLTGITCGIFSVMLGLPWWMPAFMSIVIFAGSAEFLVASLLTMPFDPINTALTIFIVNARHLFYGIPLLERIRSQGRKRFYLIYALCDESFSLHYALRAPSGIDEGWFMTWIAALNQLSWIVGCSLGGMLGAGVAISLPGISFAMTALFVVIFLDAQIRDASHISAGIGFVSAIVAFVVVGARDMMIVGLLIATAAILLLRRWIEPAYLSRETSEPVQSEGQQPILPEERETL
ncbi:AzlC family ABC transporter permease [Collinsella sp. zg1085]|uniref:AzlC family ABC transporter permease n=1 Tax=Collinsella sp. zg1085 TaxID=2844380 RepID=UPI001C0B1D6B|nr:AzlC family ABC transporter permease [Collinsella sp. zg1085]QWT17333.1 AzlC family ABC transporter permease [Collinsella sp. zg1085]